MTEVEKFLRGYNQSTTTVDINKIVKNATKELHEGLKTKSSFPMVPTYITSLSLQKTDKKLLIDAGGTNFRSAVGYIDESKLAHIENIDATKMPATDGRLSKAEFFASMANNAKNQLPETGDVGFCFSYNVEMNSNLDGKINCLAKEVDAPEVVGSEVGKELVLAIKEIDTEEKERKVVVLNDTVATLLGGHSVVDFSDFSTHIGFIFGTGGNVCYYEDTAKIEKISLDTLDKMILNVEAGGFDKLELGEFDKIVVENTADKTSQLMEKITCGKYLAEIISIALQTASKDKLFADETNFVDFELKDVSEFLSGEENKLFSCFSSTSDRTLAKELCREFIDRSAKYWAGIIGAIILDTTQKGDKPALIVAEGTTFNKLTFFRANFERYLDIVLHPANRSYKIVQGENLNLVGSLIATLLL